MSESEHAKMRVAKQTYLASKRDGALWHIATDQLHASRPDLLVLLAPAGSCVYGGATDTGTGDRYRYG